MTTWHRYQFKGCMPHCVCGELSRQLLADLADRYQAKATVVEARATATWQLDYGSVYTHPPIERFAWFGLELKIPSAAVWLAKAHLDAAELRAFGDGAQYFKLKGEATCIVMTSMQAAALRRQLAARAEGADQRATEFYQAKLDHREDKDG